MVNTRLWSDPFIQDLKAEEKLLFLYLLTNEHTNIAGFYEISLNTISFETGIKTDRLSKAIDRLSESKKIDFIDGWVCIKNFVKHQKANPKIKRGIEIALGEIPKEIIDKAKAIDRLSIDYETLSHLNPNSNPNSNSNSNSKVKEKTSSSKKLSDDEFVDALKNNIAYSHIAVEVELGKMDAWLLSNPGRKKTRRFITGWLNRIDTPLKTKGNYENGFKPTAAGVARQMLARLEQDNIPEGNDSGVDSLSKPL